MRRTKYEMDWKEVYLQVICVLRDSKLSVNELSYVVYRMTHPEIGATQAIKDLGWSNRYGWDIKRSIAQKYPEYVLPHQGGE